MTFTLADVPERPLSEVDPEGRFSAAFQCRDHSAMRVILLAERVRRLTLSRHTPELVRAIVARDHAALRRVLEPNAIREARGPADDPITPLHLALLVDDVDAVRALLDVGSDPNEPTGIDDVPVVLEAVAHASEETLDLVLDRGGRVAGVAASAKHEPPVFWVLHRKGRPAEMTRVLDAIVPRGADVRAPSTRGELLIHHAAALPQAELLEWCVANGFEIDAPDASGMTPMHKATQAHAHETLRRALALGARADARARGGRGAMHFVASMTRDPIGIAPTLDVLLGAGLSVDGPDDAGDTPLHRAATWVDVPTIEALLARGARRDVRNRKGRRPLDCVPGGSASNTEAAAIDAARRLLAD